MLTLRRITREPVAGFAAVENRLNQLFNTFGAFDWDVNGDAPTVWTPALDVIEETDATRIVAELPGVKPENVHVAVEGNTLTIRGTKENADFTRAFTLTPTVDAAAIKAAYEHGVLTVTLPKAEQAKPRQIAVEVAKS